MQFPELKYDFEYSAVQIDGGISVAYYDSGEVKEGNTLLMIHGLSSYIPAWMKLIPLIKEKFRCIAIDLPGYAKSSSGVHSGSMAFYADVIESFIKKLNLSRVSLVGHSMGGQVAMTTALKYPSIIEGLVLLAPAGFETFTENEKGRLLKNNSPQYYASATDKQIEYNFSINFFRMTGDADRMIEDRKLMRNWKNFNDYCTVVANSFRSLLEEPVAGRLAEIKQKTLIVYGLNDKFIPQPVLHGNIKGADLAREAAAKFPCASLLLLDECGHFLQFEKVKEIAEEIIKFYGV